MRKTLSNKIEIYKADKKKLEEDYESKFRINELEEL